VTVGGEEDSSFRCSGGRREDRCRCFSLRLMWRSVVDYALLESIRVHFCRQNGEGEIYAYMPPYEENTKSLLSVPPKSYGSQEYGFSVGRGSFTFSSGTWITLAQRVKLNDPGVSNGIPSRRSLLVYLKLILQVNFNCGSMVSQL
jgi:hypothetical protein